MVIYISIFMVAISTILIIQGFFSLYLMIYHWIHTRKFVKFYSPRVYEKPKLSFTAIIPARHEEAVIEHTIRSISNIDYPLELTEIIVVLREDDHGTIKQAKQGLENLPKKHAKIITFDGYPINKPHGLNHALKHATNDVIVIFDAEDEPHKDIYHIVNTVMSREDSDVVQCGVQLMNYHSSWFSVFNVLEYYFWFKSSLHFFASHNVIPLGGNTVFFKTDIIKQNGGWDQTCLTEDADIGLTLSQNGAKIRVVYDELHATQEETPPTYQSFIKQRTRWNQGFIQIIAKGHWAKFKYPIHRVLAFYVLSWPIVQTIIFILVPISIAMTIYVKLPIIVTIYSTLPIYTFTIQLVIAMIGLHEFGKDYHKKIHPKYYLLMLFGYIPYQLTLGLSATRAVLRSLSKNTTWEKTQHVNAHRR